MSQIGHGVFWATPVNTFVESSTRVFEVPVPTSAGMIETSPDVTTFTAQTGVFDALSESGGPR